MSYRSLMTRYVLALTLIGVAALAGLGAMYWIVQNASTHARVIENLEKQEDLSQNVLEHAQTFVQSRTPQERKQAKEGLLKAVDALENNHEALLNGSEELGYPGDDTPELETFLYRGPSSLDAVMREYLERVQHLVNEHAEVLDRAHPDVRYVLDEGAQKLAHYLARAHTLFRASIDTRVSRVLTFGAILVAFIWVILLLEALFIFKPMAHTIERERMELRRLNAELDRLAMVDTLTDAFNRRKFADVVHREQAAARRQSTVITLILLDIDHFKQVNDLHGHQMGDLVLKRVSSTILTHIRENDYLFRWGGEEFLVLAPGTDSSGGMALAEKLRQAIADAKGESAAVTVSLGFTILDGKEPAENALHRADQALYQSKESGRNQVRFAGPTPMRA